MYEGTLNTLMSFPTNPNGVKWSVQATTDELTEKTIVNFDDTVNPTYAADYSFDRSAGLTVINATTTAQPGHPLATAGLYTTEAGSSGGTQFSAKLLVVSK